MDARHVADRCLGCGKVGTIFCPACRELQAAVLRRVAKLWGTVEFYFALRRENYDASDKN